MTRPTLAPHSAALPSSGSDAKEDRLDRAIGYSVAFHLLVFGLFAIRTYFGPTEPIQLQPTIHVDMVGLPDKVPVKHLPVEAPAPAKEKPPEPKPAPPKPEPKPAPVEAKPETPKVNLNKTKRDEQAALRRLEALARLQNTAPPKEKEEPKEEAQPKQPAPPVRGNVASSGSSLTGLTRLQNEQYSETVHNHVTQHWALPGFLSSAVLSARVRVYIDEQGNLIKKQLIKSSNNPVFDQSAMEAVENSLPLPRPPSELVSLVSVRGIDIDFTPEH